MYRHTPNKDVSSLSWMNMPTSKDSPAYHWAARTIPKSFLLYIYVSIEFPPIHLCFALWDSLLSLPHIGPQIPKFIVIYLFKKIFIIVNIQYVNFWWTIKLFDIYIFYEITIMISLVITILLTIWGAIFLLIYMLNIIIHHLTWLLNIWRIWEGLKNHHYTSDGLKDLRGPFKKLSFSCSHYLYWMRWKLSFQRQ